MFPSSALFLLFPISFIETLSEHLNSMSRHTTEKERKEERKKEKKKERRKERKKNSKPPERSLKWRNIVLCH
jgi:Na+-transporting methylmalonyl-CoA/oxaloacetate decarboxylase gamma subunit